MLEFTTTIGNIVCLQRDLHHFFIPADEVATTFDYLKESLQTGEIV